MTEFEIAISVLRDINDKGFDAFIVGGFVRDFILGIPSHDIDISTNMPIEMLEERFFTHDIGQSKDFGILTIKVHGFDFEVAQFRTDSASSNSRHPDEVQIVNTFEEDVKRRDFTINALGMDADKNIIDFVDGKADIDRRMIRAVGDADTRFKEDALRILRMVRMASKTDFAITFETFESAKRNVHLLKELSAERVRDELFKAASLESEKFTRWLLIMKELRALDIIHPELEKLSENAPHNMSRHPEGGVWEHTLAVIESIDSTDPMLNLSALFHDIGKPGTHKVVPSAKFVEGVHHQFFGHAERSVRIVEEIARNLRISKKVRDTLIFAVGNHMKVHNLQEMRKAKILRMIAHEDFDVLHALTRADGLSRPGAKFIEKVQVTDDFIEKMKTEKPREVLNKVDSLISGKLIMEVLDIKPSKRVGLIKNAVHDALVEDPSENVEELIRTIGDLIHHCVNWDLNS